MACWVERCRLSPAIGIAALAIVLLLIMSACIGGGDDVAENTVEPVETAPPVQPTSTPDATAEPDPTATSTPEPTNTPEPTATPTNTPTPTPVPPTPTPTITPTPTPTPLPTVNDPIAGMPPIDQILRNFTLHYNVRVDGDDASSMELMVEQFSVDNYHVRVDSSGQQTEAWRVDGTTWVLGPGGVVVDLPGLVDPNLYAPSSFLFLIPDMQHVGIATVLDEDAEVDGRPATHYALDPEVANRYLPHQQTVSGEAAGTFDIWVDHDLRIIVRAEADVTWGNANDGPSLTMEFLISRINGTPEIAPPN